MSNDLDYKAVKPDGALSDFVDSFWMFANHSGSDKKLAVLPDGRIDLIFYRSGDEPLQIAVFGIETESAQTTLVSGTLIFAVSFKLLAAEYLFPHIVSDLANKAKNLPADFWGFGPEDLQDFGVFCGKATQQIQAFLPADIDERKRRLFGLIYSSNGSLSVKELSDRVYWSSRQINRYFNQEFGISLKAYCNILRFRASLQQISEGRLFPEQNFTDQNHFIKSIKRYAGVTPKALSQNKEERFFYLTTLRERRDGG